MAVFTDSFSKDVLDFVGGTNIIKDSRQSLQLECSVKRYYILIKAHTHHVSNINEMNERDTTTMNNV